MANAPVSLRTAAAHCIFQQDRLARASAELHFLLDQVGDDLGIGLGDESVALRRQLALQRQVIFDDAVMHDHNAPGAVAMRMRVLLGGPAVRRPARVADAVRPVHRDARRITSSRLRSLPGARRTSEPCRRGRPRQYRPNRIRGIPAASGPP